MSPSIKAVLRLLLYPRDHSASAECWRRRAGRGGRRIRREISGSTKKCVASAVLPKYQDQLDVGAGAAGAVGAASGGGTVARISPSTKAVFSVCVLRMNLS